MSPDEAFGKKLTPAAARVLGSLMEKEITTPEYYPLSVNAIQNAANQRSNREPVTGYDEDEIRQALHSLQDQGIVSRAQDEGRVAKYEHRMQELLNLSRAETALVCLLLLRGAQTVGELRGRSERLHRFDDLEEVQSALTRLAERHPPLAAVLPRQVGNKEPRYIQLLTEKGEESRDATAAREEQGRPAADRSRDHSFDQSGADHAARLAALESAVAALREQVSELREEQGELKRR